MIPILRLLVSFIAFGILGPLALQAMETSKGAALFSIVDRGRPRASIVIAPGANRKILEAAQTLQAYIEKSTGARLSIQDHPMEGSPTIYLGLTPFVESLGLNLKELGKEGFILEGANENSFIIVGGTEMGTAFGAYEFLERYLGVRWLLPGELGEVIPRHDSIAISLEKVQQTPAFLSRKLSPLEWNGDRYQNVREWSKFNRIRGDIDFMHNLYKLYPPEIFAKSHPEFYPMVHGARIIPDPKRDSRGLSWQPNFSADGIAEAGAERILQFLRKNPDAEGYSLGINDSHAFDESPQSLARRSGDTNALGLMDVSDDYFTWANEVIEKVTPEFPDKWFGTLAYTSVFDPPKKVAVNARIIPFMTYDRMQWAKPELKLADQDRTIRWAKAAPTLGWYDYTYGAFYRIPRVYFSLMQEYLSWASDHNVKHYYSEIYPNWAGEGPKPWILAKLLWNPKQDARALLEDWCRNAAGPAAAIPLKQYYENWEKFWIQDTPNSSWFLLDRTFCNFATPSYLGLVPSSLVEENEKLIEQAERLAETEDQRARMSQIRKMWDYYKLGVVTYQAEQLGKTNPPKTEAEALDYLDRAKKALSLAGKRKVLMDSFTLEDWNPNRFFYNTRWAHPNDVNWGSSLLWSVQPWMARSPKVRSQVEEIAKDGPLEAKDHAQIFLASLAGGDGTFIQNPNFEDGLRNWRTAKRVENQGEINSVGPTTESTTGGVLMTGPTNVALIQGVPWQPGLYYAVARFVVPKGATPPASAIIVFSPAISLNGLEDLKYVLPSLEMSSTEDQPVPGAVREVIVPLIIPKGDARFKNMNVALRVILRSPEEKILVESVQLYRVSAH